MVGDIRKKYREILIQICDSEGVKMQKGEVSQDHINRHIEYSPLQDISGLVKKLKVKLEKAAIRFSKFKKELLR